MTKDSVHSPIFQCILCGQALHSSRASIDCAGCDSSWPVVEGIPRFATAKYFGEVSENKMTALNQAVISGYWRDIVRKQFEYSAPAMYSYIADLNRASWVSLLPIPPSATVLDVGSGLGAISHALALSYDRVVSVEPVEERIRFTQLRFQQERINNVELVQTTATFLPFSPATFDLIILNGILEWIGEWDLEGSPRQAQIRFLTRVRDLLKPTGMILIGIENRFGYPTFLGRRDHPGVRFTNLMPRWLASAYLKLRAPKFYRTMLNHRGAYRTFTYSQRGYQRLLAEAGYTALDFLWPDPGYNEPYHIYHLADRQGIRAAYQRKLWYSNRIHGFSFRRLLMDWVFVRSGLFTLLAPDFLILARKKPPRGQEISLSTISKSIEGCARSNKNGHQVDRIVSYQSACHPFRNKLVMRVTGSDGRLNVVAKIANVNRSLAKDVEHGFANLSIVWRELVASGGDLVQSVPRPMGFFSVGNSLVAVEAAVYGVSWEDLSIAPRYFRNHARVIYHLNLAKNWIVSFMLWGTVHLSKKVHHSIPDDWLIIGKGSSEDNKCFRSVQHGDFYPGNIIVDEQRGQICVVDWDEMAAGYPPLFDFFCAVTGVGPAQDGMYAQRGETIDRLSLNYAFCELNWFSTHVLNCCRHIAATLGLPESCLRQWFLQYLAVRYHQLSRPGPWEGIHPLAAVYAESYRAIMENRMRTIFDETTRE